MQAGSQKAVVVQGQDAVSAGEELSQRHEGRNLNRKASINAVDQKEAQARGPI